MLLPDAILRTIVRLVLTEDEATTTQAIRAVAASGLAIEGTDLAILTALVGVCDQQMPPPTLDELCAHFSGADGDAEAVRLRLAALHHWPDPPLSGSALVLALRSAHELERTGCLRNAIIDAANILAVGKIERRFNATTKKWEEIAVKGVDAASTRLSDELARLGQVGLYGATGPATLAEAMPGELDRYQRAAANPDASKGILSGLTALDDLSGGVRRGDLALVLGFSGHMKSTFCLNWAYKAAMCGRTVGIVPLESSVSVFTRTLVALHTVHPKFRHPNGISATRTRDGTLSPDDEALYRAAAADLRTNTAYGRVHLMPLALKTTVPMIERWANRFAAQGDPLDLLFIDYLGLVDPDERGRGLETYANLNMAIRATKQLALSYYRGRGLAILSPFQANREGLKEAEKKGGQYSMRAFSGANEAERSTDLAYSVFLSDALRASQSLLVGQLKARDNEQMTGLVRVYADQATRIIDNAN
jgi:hypothetical protein